MPTPIQLPAVLTVKQLADAIGQPATAVIGKLMAFGVLATINEDIDFDTASVVADEFGVSITPEAAARDEKVVIDDAKPVAQRPAIVTIMGHVDHGKTTLLDAIRHTNVAAGEAGGITQHISSYQVTMAPRGGGEPRTITFLDTPGHSAFEAMRRHGAKITDLVILVVAADDGIKPQTIEAIRHARELAVPMLVAITKMDKPDADIERVKVQLTEHDLTPEEWGGSTVVVPVSSVSRTGLEDLLEMILLATDLRELKANPDAPAVGVVVESSLRPGIGAVATVLIQNGTLRPGDFVAIGAVSGRVRTLTDHRGKKLSEASPAMPVAVSGLSGLPSFGDQLAAFEQEKDARESARQHLRQQSAKRAMPTGKSLNATAQKEGDRSILNLIVKADTNGSLEAIRAGLAKLRNDYVEVRVVSDGVGDIAEGDITMAETTKATVIGFQVKLSSQVRQLAERSKVEIAQYRVVYELFDVIRAALAELMPIVDKELPVATIKLLARFRNNRKRIVVGGRVEEGVAEGRHAVHILRAGEEIASGTVVTVRRGKDEAKRVETGSECGLELDLHRFDDVQVGDVVKIVRTVKERIPFTL
jgi:translation initiation factor IF-2